MSLPAAVFAGKAVWANHDVTSGDDSTVTVMDGDVPDTAVMSSRTLASRNSAAADVPSLAPLVVRAADVSSVIARAAMVAPPGWWMDQIVPGAVRRWRHSGSFNSRFTAGQ